MKRLFSAILVMAMIFALIPSAFAADGETEAKSLSYVFNKASHPEASNVPDATLSTNAASVSDPWGYVGIHTFSSYSLSDNMMFFTTFNQATDGAQPGKMNPFDQESNPIRVILLELDVTAAGTYNPSISYTKDASGIIWEAHLEKQGEYTYASNTAYEHIKSVLGANTRLGKLDTCGTSGEVETAAFPTVTLEKDKYYLWFIAVAESANTEYEVRSSSNTNVNGYNASYLYLNSFDLTATPEKNKSFAYNLNSQVFNLSTETSGTDANTMYYSSANSVGYWKGTSGDTTSANFYFNTLKKEYLNSSKTGIWEGVGFVNHASTIYIQPTYLDVPLKPEATNVTYARFSLMLRVPHAGKYSVSVVPDKRNVNVNSGYIGGATNVYIQSEEPTLSSWTAPYATPTTTVKHWTSDEASGTFEFAAAGDYYIVFDVDYNNTDYIAHRDENFTDISKITRIYGNLQSITLTYTGETTEQKAINDAKAEIVSAGNDGGSGTTETAGSIKILTADISTKTGTVNSELSVDNAVIGTEYSFTAPTVEGKEFLYWTRGLGMNKAGISEDETVTVRAENNVMYLTAVYRDESSDKVSVEFYNGNRELWHRSDSTYTEGGAITLPDLPEMTGYTFTGWKLAGDSTNTLYTSKDTITATGKEMLFVAQYKETAENVTVKVNGEEKTYTYGEKVTVTANKRDTDGYKTFAYWQKKTDENASAEIVSFERSYTFRAYDGCEIEAVYREYATAAQTLRKILLSTSGKLNIAEFIGVSDAKEKGIIFGGSDVTVDTAAYRIRMTGDGDYLSAINDKAESAPIVRAYAIFENGEVLYSE